MKKNLELEDIKKIEPPLLVEEANAVGPSIYLTDKELGWDKLGNVYVLDPILELRPILMSDPPKTDNVFKYYDNTPAKPHFISKDDYEQKMIAKADHVRDLRIYNEPSDFRDFIKHILS